MTTSQELFGDQHVQRYIETDGEEGYSWRNGTKILVLFTKGRKSGEERANALIFEPDGDDYLIVASKGGAPQHPLWYRDLVAHPDVTVQVKDKVFPARARTADADDKKRLWPVMTKEWPAYDEYQEKTERDIPLVILTPEKSA
jgi:deazaflavin-dependent oxidoreductase (nitroreductase family)